MLGDLCVDIVAQDRLPFSFRKDEFAEEPAVWLRLAERAGGSAYHFARWAREYELEPTIVGCVGKDAAGQLLAEALAREGIPARLDRNPSASTARVFLAYDVTGLRILVASSESANDQLSPEFVRQVWWALDRADLVWLSGLCLRRRDAVRVRAVTEAVSSARRAGVPVVLDIVPHEFWRYFSSLPELESVIGEVDGVVSELATVRRLLGIGAPGEQLGRAELSETVDRALRLTGLAVLRLIDGGLWHQVARSRGGFEAEWTYPLPGPEGMRGFGDALACEAMRAFLRVTTGQRPKGSGLPTEATP